MGIGDYAFTSPSEATTEGVGRAFGEWLDNHPVSMADIIEDAIKKSFEEWLSLNSDEIIQAIAKQSNDTY